MFFTANLIAQRRLRRLKAAGWAFTIGIIIFSGSLYALVLTDVRAWGAVTPVGQPSSPTGLQ